MGSELKTLMTDEDEEEFLEYASSVVDSIEKGNPYQYSLLVGRFRIQLLRSRQIGNVLVSGRISIGSLQGEEMKETVKVYRKMQRWLKARYCNNLEIGSLDVKNSGKPFSKMWVGPNALQRSIKRRITLKDSAKGTVVYTINQQS